MKLLAFSGPSDSGKTWMIERLARRWTAQGLRVGVLKHCSKGYDIDRDGKDSSRFWNSGAEAVAIVGPGEWTVRRREESPDPRRIVEEAFPADLDIAIIEGFKEYPAPRVYVRGAVRKPGDQVPAQGVVATVARVPEGRPGIPEFDLLDDAGLSSFLLSSLGLVTAVSPRDSGTAAVRRANTA